MSVAVPVIDHLDVATKRIYLLAGVAKYHAVTDIYAEVRNRRRTDETLRRYPPMVTAEGNKPKGGGKYTARYSVFNHGWRVVPTTGLAVLDVEGEQITDDGQSGPQCIDFTLLAPGTSIVVNYEPPASELVRADAEIAALIKASYAGKVVLDKANGVPGTAVGIGTQALPVNNVADARAIAAPFGIGVLQLQPGNYTFGTGEDLSGFIVRGEHRARTNATVQSGANVTNCQFESINLIDSVLDGFCHIKDCTTSNVSGLEGEIDATRISGPIAITGAGNSYFSDCKSGCVGLGSSDLPVLDLSVANLHVAFRNWAGPIKIINCASPATTICIDIGSGATVIVDSSCTAGTLYVRGVGNIVDGGTMTIHHEAHLDAPDIAAEMLAAAQVAPIHADSRRMNGAAIAGSGAAGNPWRGA